MLCSAHVRPSAAAPSSLSPVPCPLYDLYHFFRVSALGATLTLPLLGAASADRRLGSGQALGLLSVALAFHAFAYVDNDLCDLSLDRTQPRRAHYPLVGGRIAPRTAFAVALACVPAGFAIDGLVGAAGPPPVAAEMTPCRRAYLASAFCLLALYNRWGKRCPFPPLTDLLQGAGWAALLCYGAAATGRLPTAFTALLAAYELLLIAMVNGIHGALRDLENDAVRGARTTAIMLGAAVSEGGALRLTPALLAYAGALQAALLALPAWGALRNLPGYNSTERSVAAAAVGALGLATVAVLSAAARGQASTEAGMAHLVLLLSTPVALVAPGMSLATRALLLAAHLLPLLPNDMTFDALRWAIGREVRDGDAG